MKIDWSTVIEFVIALAIFEVLNKVLLEGLVEKIGNYIG